MCVVYIILFVFILWILWLDLNVFIIISSLKLNHNLLRNYAFYVHTHGKSNQFFKINKLLFEYRSVDILEINILIHSLISLPHWNYRPSN